MFGECVACCESNGFAVFQDFVTQNVFSVSVGECQCHILTVGANGIGCCNGIQCQCAVCNACAFQTVAAGVIVQIPDGSVFFAIGFQFALCAFCQFHTPTCKEFCQVFLSNFRCNQCNAVVVVIAAIRAGFPQFEELVVEVHRSVCVVISQMQLPVHAQLYEYVVGCAGTCFCNFLEDSGISVFAFQTSGQGSHVVAVIALYHKGVQVVGDFCSAQFIHIMTDFVSDTPAVQTVCICFAGQHGSGSAFHQITSRTITDTDMIASCIHEGGTEHTHVTDVLTAFHRILVSVFVTVYNALCGINYIRNVFPSKDCIVKGFCCQAVCYFFYRDGQQEAGSCNICVVTDACLAQTVAVCLYICVYFCHISRDFFFSCGFRQFIPVGQFQHRCFYAGIVVCDDTQCNFVCMRTAVCQIQGAAFF